MTMVLAPSVDRSAQAELLNAKLKELAASDWRHRFEVDAERRIVTPETYAYRRSVLDAVFGSLFCERSVLVLDEVSGFYPALIAAAGARKVSASCGHTGRYELISELAEFLGAPADVVNSEMLVFHECEPYVDQQFAESHQFLLALGKIWPLFKASGNSFDAVVEACEFFVTEGLVFDWEDANWASPPPPDTYNLSDFCSALARKFEFVTCYKDWLVVAAGKLPTEPQRKAHPREERDETAQDFARRFRDTVSRALPGDGAVVVASPGDAELLQFEGRTAWHFPAEEDGAELGPNPVDGASAISQLESLRARGARFFVLPEPAFQWLDRHRELHEHLAKTHTLLLHDEETCMIFALAQAADDAEDRGH